jgi:hypothetical protein
MTGECIWTAGYALELSGADLPTKIFWAKAEYIAIASVPVAWLAFALQYTGREGTFTHRNLALLFALNWTVRWNWSGRRCKKVGAWSKVSGPQRSTTSDRLPLYDSVSRNYGMRVGRLVTRKPSGENGCRTR